VSTTERPPATADDWPLELACELVVTKQHCTRQTTSRELRTGWAVTGRILAALEAADVVGPDQGDEAGTRDVLVPAEQLGDVLDHLRANAIHLRPREADEKTAHSPGSAVDEQLVADTEALDEAHGGDKVLRGGLGLGEVRVDEGPEEAEEDEPPRRFEVAAQGDVIEAELVHDERDGEIGSCHLARRWTCVCVLRHRNCSRGSPMRSRCGRSSHHGCGTRSSGRRLRRGRCGGPAIGWHTT